MLTGLSVASLVIRIGHALDGDTVAAATTASRRICATVVFLSQCAILSCPVCAIRTSGLLFVVVFVSVTHNGAFIASQSTHLLENTFLYFHVHLFPNLLRM